MPIDNQIEPPQSFMALYVKPGHSHPNAPQEIVLARYEQCEDMTCVLAEQAQTLAFKENLSKREVLERCHQGLIGNETDFTERESQWVICRLAELMGWAPLEFGDAIYILGTDDATPEQRSLSNTPAKREALTQQIPASIGVLWRFWHPDHQSRCEVMATPEKRSEPKVGRKDPCPCGSGKKFKMGCGAH